MGRHGVRADKVSDLVEGVATKLLSEMMGRHGVGADKASDLVVGRESSHISFGPSSSCHRAPLPASVSVSLPSSVVGRGECLVSGRGRVARRAGRGSALCCTCCGLDLVGGNDNICGECLSRAFGDGSWNSCVEHGEGRGAGHVQEVAGETKPRSTSTRSGVWRSLDGTLPVGDELASIHRGTSEDEGVWRPIEGLIPVGDELVSDPRGASRTVHVETREGRTSTNRCGTRLVELGQGCEVEVKIPSDAERNLRSPGPGIHLRERWGWELYFGPLPRGFGFFLVLFEVLGLFVYWKRLLHGSAAALTAQLGRYAPCQVANARIRTGKAQLSGHILGEVAFATSPGCGGLSHL